MMAAKGVTIGVNGKPAPALADGADGSAQGEGEGDIGIGPAAPPHQEVSVMRPDSYDQVRWTDS